MNEIGVPKVSVVIPVYNADDVLLDRALGSIFSQTEQSFEIILVDDGSRNGCTQRIAEKFRNDCRLVIIRQENKGVVGAVDTGIRNCRGEFFYSIAQDDFAHPQTLEYCLYVLERDQADLCVFYGYRQMDFSIPQCDTIGDFESIPRSQLSSGSSPDDVYTAGLDRLNMDGWGHFVRMSLVKKVHEIWPLYDSVARVHFMLTMTKKWVRSSAKLYYYNTVNPASISKKPITDVFVERWRMDFKALHDLYSAPGRSAKIWDTVRRLYVIKGVKMVVNAFRRHNRGCSAEINRKCLISIAKMLREFFNCGMLPLREVNFRMYLYYRWIVFRYGRKLKDIGVRNTSIDAYLNNYGCVLQENIISDCNEQRVGDEEFSDAELLRSVRES